MKTLSSQIHPVCKRTTTTMKNEIVNTAGNYHTILGLLLVIGQNSRLKNKISHVDIRSPNLPAPIPHHPSFMNHLRSPHLHPALILHLFYSLPQNLINYSSLFTIIRQNLRRRAGSVATEGSN